MANSKRGVAGTFRNLPVGRDLPDLALLPAVLELTIPDSAAGKGEGPDTILAAVGKPTGIGRGQRRKAGGQGEGGESYSGSGRRR